MFFTFGIILFLDITVLRILLVKTTPLPLLQFVKWLLHSILENYSIFWYKKSCDVHCEGFTSNL